MRFTVAAAVKAIEELPRARPRRSAGGPYHY